MEAGGFGAVGLREHADEALLKGVNVVAHLASCAGVNDAAFCDDADLAAQSANFLRVMTAEKRGDAFGGGKPAQKFPHIPLGGICGNFCDISRLAGKSSPRVGSSRK